MDYEKKSKGLTLFRLVAGQAIGRNRHASFTPVELREIMRELDEKVPRKNPHMIPNYAKQKNS